MKSVKSGLSIEATTDSAALSHADPDALTNVDRRIESLKVFSKRRLPTPTKVYDTYWRFAKERQDIFYRRLAAPGSTWTRDPILKTHKFTNAYRASDRTSQFLIRNVIYRDDTSWQESVFRILLFKIFNKIETWQLLESELGEIRYSRSTIVDIGRVLSNAINGGNTIYSAAYIMPSGPKPAKFSRKHEMHIDLLHNMMRTGLPDVLENCGGLQKCYEELLAYPSIGPFLAYQFTTDLNYSPHMKFSESEFVMPGPGARDGLKKCFSSLGDYSEADVIRLVADQQFEEFARRDLAFKDLWGRPLQLIDCQNLFCEVDKYSRVAHPDVMGFSNRTKIKQKYKYGGDLAKPWYPPKWGLNEKITAPATVPA